MDKMPLNGPEMFKRGTEFVKGVVDWKGLPAESPGEVALAGRSNVGKSSLINALTGRRALARTSNTPGRTREVNYFAMAELFYLVDLPGYGYAKASKTDISKWNDMTNQYLMGRAPLRRVYQLIDARHGLKPNDLELMDAFDKAAVSYQVILTKGDKIGKAKTEAVRLKTQEAVFKRPAAFPRVVATSSEKGWGIEDLQQEIYEVLTN